MQTKNAMKNLANRYRAVLKRCNLLNFFGSLAFVSSIFCSVIGVANATTIKDKVITVTQSEADAGISGLGSGVVVDSDNAISFDVKDSLVLTGSNGFIAQNKKKEDLDVKIQYGANFTLGDKNSAKVINGQLGKVDFETIGSYKYKGTFNLVNGNYTVDGIYGDYLLGGPIVNVASDASLTSISDITISKISTAGIVLAEGSSIFTGTLDLKGGKIVASYDENVSNSGKINTDYIRGQGEVHAKEITVIRYISDIINPINLKIVADEKVSLLYGAGLNEGQSLLVQANEIETGFLKNDQHSEIAFIAKDTIKFTDDVKTINAQFQANSYIGNNISLEGGSFVALGQKKEGQTSLPINNFSGKFEAKNGANVILKGETNFLDKVIVGSNKDLNDTSVYIAKLHEQTSDNTFTAIGQKNDTVNTIGFLHIADLGKQTAINTFVSEEGGYISLGSMDFNSMKAQVAFANNFAQSIKNDNTFSYKSAIAIDGKDFDLAHNKVQLGGQKAFFELGSGHLFIADMGSIKQNSDSLIVGNGKTNVNIAENAGVHLVNIKADQEYTLMNNVTGSVSDNAIKSTDNILVKVEKLEYVNTNKKVVVTTSLNNANSVLGQLDTSIASILNNYAKSGKNIYLEKVLNHTANGLSNIQIANSIEGVAKSAIISGAPQQSISISTDVADYALSRTSFSPYIAEAVAIADNGQYTNIAAGDNMANGTSLWIMPIYQHQSADDFQSGYFSTGYDSDFGGVVLGADYTWANSMRLGATVNMGTGSSDSTGNFAKTKNDFDSLGFGIYAGYLVGNIGFSADMNYLHISNDINQLTAFGSLTSDFATNVISLGSRLEYKLQTAGMEIIPHLGVRYNHVDMDQMNMQLLGSIIAIGNSTSANIWQFPVGVTFAKNITIQNGWNIKPSCDITLIPVAGDKDIAQEIRFTGVAGLATVDSEIMDSISGRAKIGVEMSKNAYYMGIDYAYQGSSNMDSHNIHAIFGIKF